jgi:glycosyltransferase involved in cell wall biosynthesis
MPAIMKHAMSDTRRQGGDQSADPVLHIITGLGFGGAERLLYNIAIESVAAGHSILVVSLLPGGDFRPLFEAAGIEVMDLGMRRGRASLSALRRFVSILRARNPTVVQAWLYHANLLALVGLLLSGRRQQTTLLWGVYCTELPVSLYRWTLAPVRWLNARLSRLTDGVIYNAVRARDYHRAIGFREPRSLLLDNSVNIERFKPSCELRREVRREMNIPDDAVVVIAVARVDPMKDWPNFMTAVRSLRNVITLAVGKGTEALPEQEGFVRIGVRDDVHRMLAAADIYALSSAFGEAQSVALTEAMACGLPVVATNVGDAAFLVAGAGIVVPPRDAVALSAAIDSLARDPSLRQTLGAAARAQIVECHTARKIYETLQGTYAGQRSTP